MMKTAAAYVRVSTDHQTELSPDSQIKQIYNYAKSHHLIVPPEFIFSDEGISGKHTKNREAFNQMIAMAKTTPKPFDVILVWKFSRFARNREDSILYKSMLRKQLGIEVISITEPIGDDKMAVLMEALIEAMDEYYSINLAEEVKRGMKEKVTRGNPVSIAPFGYKMQKGCYVIDSGKAAIVRMIFEDYTNGKGCREIAEKLNLMGIPSAKGNLFETRTIAYILNNPVYIGKIRWNPKGVTQRNFQDPSLMIVNGSHKPIIKKALWDKAQAILAHHKLIYGNHTRRKPVPKFMLQGLVRCSNCGATLCQSVNDSVQCHKYASGQCNVSHSIKISKLNDVVRRLLELSFGNATFAWTPSPTETSSKTRVLLDRQIAVEQAKISRMKEAYTSGIDTLEEYKLNKSSAEHTLIKLNQLRDSVVMQPVDTTPKQQSILDIIKSPSVSNKEKNDLLREVIDHIVFHRKDNRLKIVYRS